MSDRTRKQPTDLRWVYPVDGSKAPVLFSGSLEEAVSHINAMERTTGIQHATISAGK